MKWQLPEQGETPIIDWIIQNRNITDKERFLNPQLDHLHSPFLLHDMKLAVDYISSTIKSGKKIFIHGDFDVDGITATSIMWLFLKNELNADVLPYIPNRFVEGYGLSEDSIQNIIAQGGNLIITVDCGVKDIALVKKYSNQIDFIITDHHTVLTYEGNEVMEGAKKVGVHLVADNAKAVVHPVLENSYPFKEICGAVVSWKVCCAINEQLGLGIDMKKYMDLAALGTVCDIMPLVDENRAIVKLGLDQMRKNERIGLSALMKIANVDSSSLSSFHLGYVVGPRLNASGRLESAMDGVRLLTTSSNRFAGQLAAKLEELNNERRELTKRYFEIAEEQIAQNGQDEKLIFVYGDEWPEGILGLIAGKLTEKHSRPVIVGSLKDGRIKASARSIAKFNIAENLKLSSHYLLTHGGHAQAAGLSFLVENFEKLRQQLYSLADSSLKESDFEKLLEIDAIAQYSDLNFELLNTILSLEPFGHSNKRPLIAVPSLRIKNYSFIGSDKNHVKVNFVGDSEVLIEAIGFGMADRFNTEVLNNSSISSALLDIACYIELNEWNGRKKLSLKLEDFRTTP